MIAVSRYDPQTKQIFKDEAFDKLESHQSYWINADTPTTEELARIAGLFGIEHPTKEFLYNPFPKAIPGKDYYLLSFLALEVDMRKDYQVKKVGVIIGPHYLVTIHRQEANTAAVWQRYQQHPDLWEQGIDFLLYHLLDTVVDHYFQVLDLLEADLGKEEEMLFTGFAHGLVSRIFAVRKRIIRFRNIAGSMRNLVNILLYRDVIQIDTTHEYYFFEIYDHTLRVIEHLDIFREQVSGLLEAYLTLTSNRLNEIVKVLTVASTIILPMTLVSSIYGMNFRYMPELYWRGGYPFALGIMAAIPVIMLVIFKRKGWI